MSGNKRQRELARQKFLRQQARRAQQRRRAQIRARVTLATLAAAAVIVGVVFAGGLFGDDGQDAAAEPNPTVSPTVPGQCDYRPVDASGGREITQAETPPVIAATEGTVMAVVHTNLCDIELELDQAKAPCTVNSFVSLAEQNYFKDTNCHRLLTGAAGGVLQCGDPSGTGRGGPGYEFDDENLEGATYTEGVLAMANSGPNTNGSQFFMVYADSGFDPAYTPFGRITKGLDILAKVAEGGVTGPSRDQPKTKVVIEDVEIVRA